MKIGGENYERVIAEKRLGALFQEFCERGLRFICKNGADVLQAIHLGMHLAIDVVIAMANADGDDAAEEIQVLISVRIPNVLILGVRNHERFLVVMEYRRKKIVAIREDDLFFGHA